MNAQLESGMSTVECWSSTLHGEPFQSWVLANPQDASSRLVPVCVVNRTRKTDPTETAQGRTQRAQTYQDDPLIDSWNFYLRWKNDHPGEKEIPPWVTRMRSNDEHARWLAGGQKPYQEWSDEQPIHDLAEAPKRAR